MFHMLRNEMNNEEGFTLIELLVVILIIGILAAIAIPSFLNQRYKGQDACAKSMAKQMQTAIKTYQTDKNTYSGATMVNLNAIENTVSANTGCKTVAGAQKVGSAPTSGTDANCGGTPTDTAFCVSSTSASNNVFALTETGGAVTRTCSSPTGGNAGACVGAVPGTTGGTW